MQRSQRESTIVRVLVTGGAGFVGSHLVEALTRDGYTPTVFDKRYVQGISTRFIVGDLLTDHALDAALDGQHMVIHLAANASVRGGTSNPSLDLQQNTLATARLLEAARKAGVQRFVFASSSAVYGDPPVVPTPEDCPFPEQTSLYGASKVACEALLSAYCHGFGMQGTVFRFVPMLGEGYRRGHVWDFYQKLIEDQTRIEILGDGEQRKSYIHVHDAVRAVTNIIDRRQVVPFNVWNVSGTETASVNDNLDTICAELGVNPERVYTGASWAGDKRMTLLDASKIRSFGWEPKITIKEAVLRTLRSFHESPSSPEPAWASGSP